MSSNAPVQKRKYDTAGQIFAGIFCILAALYLHNLFTDLETGAIQSTRLNAIIILMYKILGHMPTILIIAGMGVILIVLGIREMIMRIMKARAG